MDGFDFKDIFQLIAVELDSDIEEIRKIALSGEEGVTSLIRRLEKTDFDSSPPVLSDPIMHPAQSLPLVAADLPITVNRIKSLALRQLNNPEETIGPFSLSADEATVNHYRAVIKNRFETIIASLTSSGRRSVRQLHAAMRSMHTLSGVEKDFTELVDTLLASPRSVGVLLARLAGSGRDIFEDGVDTSLVAIALRILAEEHGMSIPARIDLKELGLAALLQDTALEKGAEIGHPAVSAALALDLGLGPSVARLITLHHRMTDDQGTPIYRSGEFLTDNQSVLITVNGIMKEVWEEPQGGQLDTAKSLYHLAKMGYLDIRVVKAFSRLYLPKSHAAIMEKAESVKEYCPHGISFPILWPLSGGKAPTLFICGNSECINASNQVTRLARDIPLNVLGRDVALIRKGDYFTCPYLTGKLKLLYDKIREILDRRSADG